MTRPRVEPAKLRRIRPWEYALRFGFGGAVTVGAHLVTQHWGTPAGGLLLAFPAILPASLTLVKEYDGRRNAVEDARGGRLGAIALACFAAVVALTATRWPPVAVLVGAALVWLAVAAASWFVVDSR